MDELREQSKWYEFQLKYRALMTTFNIGCNKNYD